MDKLSLASSCAETLSVILHSTEISDLVDQLEFLRWTGRPGYSIRSLMGVALAKSLYAIPTWTRTLALVREHAALREAIGCTEADVPSIDAVYRFTKKLCMYEGQRQECIDAVLASLHEKNPEIGRNVAIDASDVPAYAKDGSDPHATWGHRSGVSTRPGGTFLGYKLHLAVDTATELPLAWKVETARTHESKLVASLLDELQERGFSPNTAALDRGYDHAGVYFDCTVRGIDPIIPLRQTPEVKRGEDKPPECEHGAWKFAGADRKRRATKWRCPTGECQPSSEWVTINRCHPAIPRETEGWDKLYNRRGSVERAFGRLKMNGLVPLRVRRLERVALHSDLTIVTRLAVELAKIRQAH